MCSDTIDSLEEGFVRVKASSKSAVEAAARSLELWDADVDAFERRSYCEICIERSGGKMLGSSMLSLDSTQLNDSVDATASTRSVSVLQLLGLSGLAETEDEEQEQDDEAEQDAAPESAVDEGTESADSPNSDVLEGQGSDELGFDRGLFEILGRVQSVLRDEDEDGPVLVLIGGAVGSGKSSLGTRICEVFGSQLLQLDNFIREPEAHSKVDESDFAATDLDLLRQVLHQIRSAGARDGAPVELPRFCFRTGERQGGGTFRPCKVLVLCGTHALRSEIGECWAGRVVRIGISGGQSTHLIDRVCDDLSRAGVAEGLRGRAAVAEMVLGGTAALAHQACDVAIANIFDPLVLEDDGGFWTLKSTFVCDVSTIKERLFGDPDAEQSLEHWTETALQIFLSPPGLQCQPGDPYCLRVRQFNGRIQLVQREYMAVEDYIRCPSREFSISQRVLRGLLRAGYSVAGLLEVHSEVVRSRLPGGLTVSVDTLPQLGIRMMQLSGPDKASVGKAAELLDCSPHSFVAKSYPTIMAESFKPGLHAAARTHWVSRALGTVLSDALAPHFAKLRRIEREAMTVDGPTPPPPADDGAVPPAAAQDGAGKAESTEAEVEAEALKRANSQLLERQRELERQGQQARQALTRWRLVSGILGLVVVVVWRLRRKWP